MTRFDLWRLCCPYLMKPIDVVRDELARQSRAALAMLKPKERPQ